MTTMPQMVFPAPDHDHGRCATAAIAHAEAHCAARAQRLTPIRRHVLEALLASHKPLGAYEIIEHLAQKNSAQKNSAQKNSAQKNSAQKNSAQKNSAQKNSAQKNSAQKNSAQQTSAAQKNRPAPITIYRALDFLRENGLVHRIESRNAFVACAHNHGDNDLVVFLICEKCGAVGEAPGGGA